MQKSNEDVQKFMKNVLKDARALERMLEEDWFETDVIRIGAEQELCLIDEHGKAMPNAMEVMDALGDGNYTTEIAKFNIEINLEPLEFKDNCLSQMEENLQNEVAYVRKKVQELGGDILLTGILPSIRKSDVAIENLTPLPRYKALCDAIDNMRGKNMKFGFREWTNC